jgi:hypothetical protein
LASHDRDDRLLQEELKAPPFRALFGRLRQRHSFFERFPDWGGFVDFMRGGGATEEQREAALRILLGSHREDGDSRWRTVLLAVCWPSLQAIRRNRLRWDPEPSNLWDNVVWSFLQAICEEDLLAHPAGLLRRIPDRTAGLLQQEYRKIWLRAGRERQPELGQLEGIVAEPIGEDPIESRDPRREVLGRLERCVERGVIGREDLRLIVATRLEGVSISEYARRLGIPLEAAKKRRSRALAQIKKDRNF